MTSDHNFLQFLVPIIHSTSINYKNYTLIIIISTAYQNNIYLLPWGTTDNSDPIHRPQPSVRPIRTEMKFYLSRFIYCRILSNEIKIYIIFTQKNEASFHD